MDEAPKLFKNNSFYDQFSHEKTMQESLDSLALRRYNIVQTQRCQPIQECGTQLQNHSHGQL